jgi:hypothetical protein
LRQEKGGLVVTQGEYEAYKTKVLIGLKELLNSTGTRPVLFAGAGEGVALRQIHRTIRADDVEASRDDGADGLAAS